MTLEQVDFKAAKKNDYYTIVGAGGDLQEWVDGYKEMLAEQEIGEPKAFFTCKGSDVNAYYRLSKKNRLKDDLTLLFFPLDGLDISRLAIFKIKMGDHWFSDVVANLNN